MGFASSSVQWRFSAFVPQKVPRTAVRTSLYDPLHLSICHSPEQDSCEHRSTGMKFVETLASYVPSVIVHTLREEVQEERDLQLSKVKARAERRRKRKKGIVYIYSVALLFYFISNNFSVILVYFLTNNISYYILSKSKSKGKGKTRTCKKGRWSVSAIT